MFVVENVPLPIEDIVVKVPELTTPPASAISFTYKIAETTPAVVARRATKDTW